MTVDQLKQLQKSDPVNQPPYGFAGSSPASPTSFKSLKSLTKQCSQIAAFGACNPCDCRHLEVWFRPRSRFRSRSFVGSHGWILWLAAGPQGLHAALSLPAPEISGLPDTFTAVTKQPPVQERSKPCRCQWHRQSGKGAPKNVPLPCSICATQCRVLVISIQAPCHLPKRRVPVASGAPLTR